MRVNLRHVDRNLPRESLRAMVEPSSVDAEARTVDLRWYSGAYVRRYSWEHGPIDLAFEMKPAAVRLDRLKNGAPLLNAHSEWTLSDIIGVVEKATVEGGNGYATVRFSDRAEVDPIFRDVQNGIIRNVSMGVIVHQMKEVTEKGDARKKFLAIDWEPVELSFVPVGADPGAHSLSDKAAGEEFPCRIILSAEDESDAHQGGTMKTRVRLLADVKDLGRVGDIVEIDGDDIDEKLHWEDPEDESGFEKRKKKLAAEKAKLAAGEPDAKADARAVDDALAADTARAKEIRRLGAHYNMDDIAVQFHVKNNSPIQQVIEDFTERRARDAEKFDGAVSLGQDFEAIGWKMERMADAIASRAMRKACPEPAREYALSSIAECAYSVLKARGMTYGRGLDPRRQADEVVRLALHTTSDFPLLMANALNKALLPAYQLAPQTFRTIGAQKTFRDFRAHPFLRIGDFPVPLQVDEHGEFKSGTMSETSESVTAFTYGRIVGISRQLMVNDDLGAFQDIANAAGVRVAAFMNTLFYQLCILAGAGLGPTMSASSGGVAVYNAAHGNVASAGALDNTRLGEALSLMIQQRSLDGIPLNVMPRYLLVPSTSYVLAKTLLTAVQAAQASQVNAFAGMLEPITDANLGTGTRYYVLADPAVLPNYVWGQLEGQDGPRVETQPGFKVDGIEVKVAIDFGAGAIEFRGGVTGAGA